MRKFQIIYHSDKSLRGGFDYEYPGSCCRANFGVVQGAQYNSNGLSNIAAVPQATIKSILNGESQNPGVVTIKKLCDGLEITLGEFFSTSEFDHLEQEIV